MLLRSVTPDDHAALYALWACTPGMQLRQDDEAGPFAAYLARNPGLSVLIEVDGQLVGCLLAGHDGRRGYLQHLVVVPAFRGQGLARRMLEVVLTRLGEEGIGKAHVFVLQDAPQALAFWAAQTGWGWVPRDDIQVFSKGS